MSEDVAGLRALSEAATPGPWATLAYWPREIVPADQQRLPLGAASDPVADLRYAQPIARSEYSDTPGKWRARFPHRRLDETLANTDAAFIVAAVNYVRAALAALPQPGEPTCDFPLSDGRVCTRLAGHDGVHQ